MTVELSTSDSIARLVLNRPEKLNAVNGKMAEDLLAAITRIASESPRVLIMSGAGRGFCAGRDLDDAEPADEDAEAVLSEIFNPLFGAIRGLPMPTIAQVHGPALGVGLGLAMACDIVYAAASAKVGSPFARIGAVLDSGGHRHLVDRVGPHLALELIYTGRLISGVEAAEMGLVNRAFPDEELATAVDNVAGQIATGPTAAFALSKQLVQRLEDAEMPFDALLAAEAAAQGAASRTADYREGISAFQQKRRPGFTGS